MSQSPNADTVEYLREIAMYYDILGRKEDKFRAKATLKAADAIEKLDERIDTAADAKTIPGIDKIGDTVENFARYGIRDKLEELKTLAGTAPKYIDLFKGIYGVGPVKARKLYNAGYTTINDIPDSELTSAQKIGKKYYTELNTRLERREVSELFARIELVLDTEVSRIDLVGSYRRGAITSGDIDILLCADISLKEIVAMLKDEGIILHNLALGTTKYAGVTSDPIRRIDIRLVQEEEYACALMYFTGSKNFNVDMRLRAKSMYMKLSEYSLYLMYYESNLPIEEEEDIFAALDMEYVPPTER